MNHRIKLIGKALPVSAFGDPYLWFESLSGHEAINELYQYELIVHTKDGYGNPAHSIEGQQGYVSKSMSEAGDSPASHLELQKLIGTTLGIDIALSEKKLNLFDELIPEISISGKHTKHGLIRSIKQLTTHNLHAVYQITLVPWLWLLTQTNNYRIYQNQKIPHIIEDVLSRYPYPVEYRLSDSYATLDYQTQYNESDYQFVVRLMAEHGINFHFEHTSDQHTLVLTDHNSHYLVQDNPAYQDLIIYPPNQRMPNYAEYLEHFHPAQSLVTGQSLLSDYQFKTPQLILTAHDQYQWAYKHNDLQRYEWQQGLGVDEEALQTKVAHRTQSYYQHGHRAYGQGRLKAIQVGHTFTLHNHPNTDSNIEWLVIGIQTTIQNLNPDNRTHQYYTADTQFIVQPKAIELKPDRILPKPLARVQTATVVAPNGEEIYTDEHGRIKVKFHWDRPSYADRQLFEALDAKEINTCWLRVSTAWAGENYGAIQLPRAGQEVIVDFFGGDPDMPFVSGRLTNPDNMPVWQLPNERVLSGLRSKEYQGSQSNQLVMDDTTGKLQVHLRSDHQASELNLGSITRINPVQGRADFRGEGFELRTDGHGVVRADKGLVLTSFGKSGASSYVKDIADAVSLLNNASNQQTNYIQSAIDYMAEDRAIADTASPAIKDDLQTIKGDKPRNEVAKSHVVIGSPASVVAVAESNIHQYAKANMTLTSGADLSIATGKKLLASVAKGIGMLAHSMGIKLIAASDKIEIYAQRDGVDVIADENLRLISKRRKVEITAMEEIVLNVKGTYIKITPEGIEQGTTGDWKVHASQHELTGPNSIGFELPKDPYDEMFVLKDQLGNVVPGFAYKITTDDGKVYRGITNEKGETIRVGTANKAVSLKIEMDDEE